MKNLAFILFKVALFSVLIGKVLNWFLNFSDQVNQILNTSMFCLLGIGYFIAGLAWTNKWLKGIFIACGIYLVVMNLIEKNTFLTVIGIACILSPMLIARFSPDEKEENELTEG